MSESRVRENRTHGSIGGRWGGNAHGETEPAPSGETRRIEPVRPTSRTEPVAYLTRGHFARNDASVPGSEVWIAASVSSARPSNASS